MLSPSYNALVVRPHIPTTSDERAAILRSIEYNVFAFPAALLTCDFLSDSGTSAMTDVQWAAMLRGDESYGRNSGYYCLLDAVRDVFERGDDRRYLFRDVLAGTADASFYQTAFLRECGGGLVNGGLLQLARPNFFLVPQGRCAEMLLFSTMRDVLRSRSSASREAAVGGQTEPQEVGGARPALISNGFFDTTGANASAAGFELHTFTEPGLTDPFPAELVGKINPFKGNLDVKAAAAFLSVAGNADRVTMILLTITNNWAAGQPVSMANIKEVALLAKQHDIPLFFDACRFAENAKFVQDFELGYRHWSIAQITREIFAHADGFTMSFKKDGLANMGGALSFRDQGIFPAKFGQDIGIRLKERQIMCFGNDSYGGMSGRDIMAVVAGLYEVTKEAYLANRLGQVRRFAERLTEEEIPVLLPPGGHAIFLDMDRFFEGCGRSYGEFASVGFTLELLRLYGIRSIEAGPFGWEWDKKGAIAQDRDSIPNLVRFAVPRYVMTDGHLEYTVDSIVQLYRSRHTIPGVRITRGKELRMRLFHVGLEPIPVEPPAVHGEITNGVKADTFFGRANGDLSNLRKALKLGNGTQKALQEGLRAAMQSWGLATIPERPSGWLSDVGLNHSPMEYSISIELNTAAAELRFLVEAQASENTLAAYQHSALSLNRDVRQKYPRTAAFDRFDLVEDLFFPSQLGAQGPFTAWHAFAVSRSSGESAAWKLYLNPNAAGKERAAAITREAMIRLGMPGAWSLLESIKTDAEDFAFFSLDLRSGPQARVKVYVRHNGYSGPDGVLEKLARVGCSEQASGDMRRFHCILSGGSDMAYRRKAMMTCFAFTAAEKCGDAPMVEFSSYYPIAEGIRHDAEARDRIETFLRESTPRESRLEVLNKYQASIESIAHRPPQQGRGLHAWVGFKHTHSRGPVMTVYFSADIFGPPDSHCS